jgi:hypothetical protein
VNIRLYIVLSNKTDVNMLLPTNLKTGNKRIAIRDLGNKKRTSKHQNNKNKGIE